MAAKSAELEHTQRELADYRSDHQVCPETCLLLRGLPDVHTHRWSLPGRVAPSERQRQHRSHMRSERTQTGQQTGLMPSSPSSAAWTQHCSPGTTSLVVLEMTPEEGVVV